MASGLLTARQVWAGAWGAFLVAAIGGVYLAAIAGWVIIAIGAASIVAALGYTSGPYPYGYRGLGEVFVFVFFGLVATVGSRYVHDRTAPADAWLLAVPVGFLIAAILVVNNMRDIDTDAAAGKRTLAVIIGRRRTGLLYAALVWSAFGLAAAYALWGAVPAWTALGLAAIPAAYPLVKMVLAEAGGRRLNVALKGTAQLQAVFGLLVATGAALG